jgi:hypothetical protein
MALECSLILRSSRRRHGATAGRKPDDPVEFTVPMGGGLILSPDAFIYTNRKLIIELASRYQLPAIFGIPSLLMAPQRSCRSTWRQGNSR